MDHMAMADMDKDMIDARAVFIRLATEPGGLAKWAEQDQEASAENASIRLILNDFELVSTAIQFGIADYAFYHKYNHGTVKRYWTHAAPYIHALRARTGSQTVYEEFEQLHNWVGGGKRPRRKILWKKFF